LIFEALQSITLSTKTRGAFSLNLGDRLNWPDEDAKRVLTHYPEKFRLIETSTDPWLHAWRDLAEMTRNVEEADWRFLGVMDLLNGCDKAFESGNWAAFQRLAEKAKTLCQKK
jgi:hypothetical protein